MNTGNLLRRKEIYNGRGFVELVDVMPSDGNGDKAIVDAARVSYDKGTKVVRSDSALIDYLMRHEHTSPFEMVEFKFRMKVPIFVARQIFRHRTANFNEVSGRYSILEEEYFVPEPDSLGKQSDRNRQCREKTEFENAEKIIESMKHVCDMAFDVYRNLLDQGLARELSRIVLPLSTYTMFVYKQDLKNLLHFLEVRISPDAQKETREVAEAILELIEPFVPRTLKSWRKHILESIRLNSKEIDFLREHLPKEILESIIEKIDQDYEGSKGEKREFIQKLSRLIE